MTRVNRAPRPLIAISMGDPAGIGPEVTLKALTAPGRSLGFEPILVGDPYVFAATARRLRLPLELVPFGQRTTRRRIAVVASSNLEARERGAGPPRSAAAAAACGEAAYAAIIRAVQLVQRGVAVALVTAPIAKAHLAAAGHDFPGHTELLAELSGGVPVRMMLAGPQLRVVLVTIHMALAAVPRHITRARVRDTIQIAADALRNQFAFLKPRLAVAGLNPHAGENGLFGTEELRVIGPAVADARRRGIDVSGPLAADGLFALAAQGRYDAIICMYHDQGLAPFKLLHFADGVNVTLGLPFPRTSPDHGTAFDIAGRSIADPRSMQAALRLAAQLGSPTRSAARGR